MAEPQQPNAPETPDSKSDATDRAERTQDAKSAFEKEDPQNGNAPAADPRVGELETLLVHLKADFDNYKKRTQKEIGSSVRAGELDAVKRFLPALSNLERAIGAATAGGEAGALLDGLRQVHQQFQQLLAQMGVERIPAVGLPFDPTLHDAVAAAARPDVPPGTVTDEYEPGYRADGKALIPAKVRVATAE